MYYQNFKYPARYAQHFYNDGVSVWLDTTRGKVKVVGNGRTRYYDIDSLPRTVGNVSREMVMEKFK